MKPGREHYVEADITPYPQTVAFCDVHGWETRLEYRKGVWFIKVKDHGKTVAAANSGHQAPNCFRILAQSIRGDLEKYGGVTSP